MGIERTRVAEVYAAAASGGRVGSGYLLDDHLVLTARHVVEPSTSVEVRPLGRAEWVGASVVWSDEAADAALLRVDGGGPASAGAPPRWGTIGGREAVAVSAVGFPWAQARPHGSRDSEQLFGHVAPLSGAKGGRYAVSVTTSAPHRPGGGSGWEGMSGAALFAGPYLVGVVVVDPARFGPERVVATPAGMLLSSAEFRDRVGAPAALTTVGSRFRLEVAADLSVAVVAPYRDLPPAFDPAAVPVVLLAPEHGIVPFLGREAELAELARWCDAEGPLGLRVVSGAGGSGKTRLGAEACVAATARGWVAGFADARVPGGETALELEDRTLLVVDEADTKVDLLAGLLAQLLYTPTPARVLLVTRRLGLWFDQLAQEVPYLEGLPGVAQPITLDRATLEEEERDRHFAAAAAFFGPRLGVPPPTVSPWALAEPAFATPLLVHMSALVAARGGGPDERPGGRRDARGEVLDGLVEGERRRWRRTAAAAGLADLAPQVVDRAVAAATLTGADDEAEALWLLEAVSELADPERRGKVARWLHELYPGDAWLNSLQPDLLVARHLSRTLPEVPEVLIRLYDRAGSRRSALLATVVGAADEPALVPVLRRLVEDRLANLVEAATDDAALAPLVARLCQLAPAPEVAATVVESLPTRTTSLATLAAVLQEQATAHYRALAETAPDAFLPELARSLGNLSLRLRNIGDRQRALAAAEEAIELSRALAGASPDHLLPGSLHALATNLAEVGRHQEALAAMQQAVDSYRDLAEVDPDTFEVELAAALLDLSVYLAKVGRHHEALTFIEQTVDRYRSLVDAAPADDLVVDHAASFAKALANLSGTLADLRRHEEAVAPMEDAVKMNRVLAEVDPDAYLPDLAASLDNLAVSLANVGRRDEGLAMVEEAVEIYRALAEANPDVFLPELALALTNLSVSMLELRGADAALTLAEEAVAIDRPLAKAIPDAFQRGLAGSLNNLSLCLAALGRREDALASIEEAVTITRALAAATPGAFLPMLAGLLGNLSQRLSEMDLPEEALIPSAELVDVYRALAASEPEAHLPGLTLALGDLSRRLAELGRVDEAIAAVEEAAAIPVAPAGAAADVSLPQLARLFDEVARRLAESDRLEQALTPIGRAVAIYRALAETDPETFLPDLGIALSNLGDLELRLGRPDALEAAEESVAILRPLAEANPAEFRANLAPALRTLSAAHADAGRPEIALVLTEELVGIYRLLTEADADTFSPDLAVALSDLAELRRQVDPSEALEPAEQAVALLRPLTVADPDASGPNLGTALMNLGVIRLQLGRLDDALQPVEEAVDLLRSLVDVDPDALGPNLALALTNLSAVRMNLGLFDDALEPAKEAVYLLRPLAENHPDLFGPSLSVALTNLSDALASLGRRKEARAARREAESFSR